MYSVDHDRFIKALKLKGFRSIEELAQHLGIHRNTIHYYLSDHPIFPTNFSKMLAALELEPEQVIVKNPREPHLKYEAIAPTIDELHSQFPQVSFVLFGSRTREKHHHYSDWDIGVFSYAGLTYDEYLKIYQHADDLTEDFPYFVQMVNLNQANQSFLSEISKTWVFLVGRQQDWMTLQKKAYHGH